MLSETTLLEVIGLGHTYGTKHDAHTAIDDLTFDVQAGELVCIVGPSGSGKSTLLRIIAGMIQPTRGSVILHGDRVRSESGDTAMVFQDYSRSLFPWQSVQRNVEFPLRNQRKGHRRERAAEALEWVGLTSVKDKYPWQLSGGMQQRVAIARALAYRPALLLLDEPFASMDAQSRFELEDLLLTLHREHATTVLLVTHDIDESVYLGDRVLVLSKSPATIVADLPVPLPAARDQIVTRNSEEYVSLRAEIAGLLWFPISIYLSDAAIHDAVESSVISTLEAAGLSVVERDDPILGSWFRRLRGSAAMRDLGATAAHAADSRLVLEQDAKVTATLMQHIGPVIASLQHTKDAVLRLGAILIVKVDDQLAINQLTAAQQLQLDHHPDLALAPRAILTALQIDPSQQPPTNGLQRDSNWNPTNIDNDS